MLTITNHSAAQYTGWIRANCDCLPPIVDDFLTDRCIDFSKYWPDKFGKAKRLVVGRQTGLDTKAVDVWVEQLAPGERIDIELLEGLGYDAYHRGPVPADPLAALGGPSAINGFPMEWVSLEPDGAGYTTHLRHIEGMLTTDVWMTWYPEHPAFCQGETTTTCSRIGMPANSATTGTSGINLTLGDALVIVPGAGISRIVAPVTTFADGQAVTVPVLFFWPRLAKPVDWMSASALMDGMVGCIAIEKILADGNPRLPQNFNALRWAQPLLPQAVARLHTWQPGVLGPNLDTKDTGAQEDQWFRGGECLAPAVVDADGHEVQAPGAGVQWLNLLAAYKQSNRPCHHREADGSIMRPWEHNAMFWDGRVHFASPDKLGKVGGIDKTMSKGWWGPDVEHWQCNRIIAAARLYPSKAVQAEMASQAVVYLQQQTTKPGWATSQPWAARAIGYEGYNAVHLWRGLEDRSLAEHVKQNWLSRWSVVLKPYFEKLRSDWPTGYYMDVRVNDPRLAPGPQVMPWQQALGAYGTWVAGTHFEVPEAREWAFNFAKEIVERCFYQRPADARWATYALLPADGTAPTNADNIFYQFAMPMAVWVVLQREPQHEQAKAIWAQLLADATTLEACKSLPPGGGV